MRINFLKDTQISYVMNAVTAGTTEQKSSVLDMTNFQNVIFILALGTVTDGCVLTLSAYGNTASSTSSPTPVQIASSIAGPVTAAGSSNLLMVCEVLRPSTRYVFADVLRTTQNAVINGIIAIQYGGTLPPFTQLASQILASTLSTPGV
jgi:hypothetical protein